MNLDTIEPKQFSPKAKECVPSTHFSDKLDSIHFRESKNWVGNTFKKFSSGQFSRSVMSNSMTPWTAQHARPPCLPPTPGVHPNPCPSSRWCHPTISSSVVPFSSCPQSFPSIRVFSHESAIFIRWPKDWRFSFSHQSFQCIFSFDFL